jgi:hypothetical protein
MFFAAPAGSGCGTRQVSRDEPSPTAPSAEAPPAAPETAPETGTETETETAAPPAPAAAPPAAEEPPPAPALAGDYECRFTRGEREFAPAPCAIRPGADGELRLEQTGGPIRLSGTVTEDEAGFRLSGEVTCARGPCPGRGSRDVLFFSQGKTAYSAVLPLRSGLFLNIDLVRKD